MNDSDPRPKPLFVSSWRRWDSPLRLGADHAAATAPNELFSLLEGLDTSPRMSVLNQPSVSLQEPGGELCAAGRTLPAARRGCPTDRIPGSVGRQGARRGPSWSIRGSLTGSGHGSRSGHRSSSRTAASSWGLHWPGRKRFTKRPSSRDPHICGASVRMRSRRLPSRGTSPSRATREAHSYR